MKCFPFRLLVLVFSFAATITSANGQAGLLDGKKIGLYLSSTHFQFDESYNIPVSQFLRVEEDRSQLGQLRSEFMIRLGEMFSRQLDSLSGADTVVFLNSDPGRIRAFRDAYDSEQDSLLRSPKIGLDFVLVISEFDLQTRIHKSVYIQSNRMITDRIPIMVSRLRITLTDLQNPELRLPVRSCFDDQTSSKPKISFDFYAAGSPLGKFLSHSFSRWWDLMVAGEREGCAN